MRPPRERRPAMLRRPLAALLLLLLAGCARPDVAQTGDNSFQLQLRPSWYTVPASAVTATMARRSLDLCPLGYERDHSAFERVEGELIAVWDIHCL